MVVDLQIGDVLRLKTPHPCGNNYWNVVRLGADIGIQCNLCTRYVMIARPYLERRIKDIIRRDTNI